MWTQCADGSSVHSPPELISANKGRATLPRLSFKSRHDRTNYFFTRVLHLQSINERDSARHPFASLRREIAPTFNCLSLAEMETRNFHRDLNFLETRRMFARRSLQIDPPTNRSSFFSAFRRKLCAIEQRIKFTTMKSLTVKSGGSSNAPSSPSVRSRRQRRTQRSANQRAERTLGARAHYAKAPFASFATRSPSTCDSCSFAQ